VTKQQCFNLLYDLIDDGHGDVVAHELICRLSWSEAEDVVLALGLVDNDLDDDTDGDGRDADDEA
jgi:hypothetical protein